MSYPPAIPPADVTNNTPQVDRHPVDHNSITDALRDIVNELGPNPSGSAPTLEARLALADAIVTRSGSHVGVAAYANVYEVVFPIPFAGGGLNPVVVVTNGDANSLAVAIFAILFVDNTRFTCMIHRPDGSGVTGMMRINYIANGPK